MFALPGAVHAARPPQPYHRQPAHAASRRCRRPPLRFCLLWAAFSFVLLAVYLLRHDVLRQPDAARRIGWQAHERIAARPGSAAARPGGGALAPVPPSEALDAAPDPQHDFDLSFPLDVYAPLLPNPAPLVDVTVHSCFALSPATCRPPSDAATDARLGRWVRVERPLDAEAALQLAGGSGGGVLSKVLGGLEARFLFYRRSRRVHVPRIVDLRIVHAGQAPPTEAGWRVVTKDLTTSMQRMLGTAKSAHLWFRVVEEPAVDEMEGIGRRQQLDSQGRPVVSQGASWADDAARAITEIDIKYGPGPAWPGFTEVGPLSPPIPSLSLPSPHLLIRRQPEALPPIPIAPKFREDGTFKIMQVADMHFSTTPEKCRDTPSYVGDDCGMNTTSAMLGRWLDEEKPDLVVFSGDQLNGEGTSWDERSTIPSVLMPVIERRILFASIPGQSDSQSGRLSRREQQMLLSRLPYSMARTGPTWLHDGTGAGNYFIRLISPKPDRTHLFTLYFLDSGDAAPKSTAFKLLPGKLGSSGNDYIRKDQIDWFLEQSAKVKKHLVPFKPDGGVDLGKLWPRSHERRAAASSRRAVVAETPEWSADAAQGTALRKAPALLWTHMPLPEFFDKVDMARDGREMIIGQDRGDAAGSKGTQGQRGIFAAMQNQRNDRDVVGVLSGHLHNNADCRRVQYVWMCFNGGSSYLGYGDPKIERRVRVMQLRNWGERIDTWHRYEKTAGRVDEATLWEMHKFDH